MGAGVLDSKIFQGSTTRVVATARMRLLKFNDSQIKFRFGPLFSRASAPAVLDRTVLEVMAGQPAGQPVSLRLQRRVPWHEWVRGAP